MNTAKLKNRLGDKVQALQTELTEPMEGRIITMPNTALAPINSGYLALKNNALDIVSENLKNQPLSYQLFDIIKSPSGGATAFTVPGLSGDDIEKELVGIIADYTLPRAYWSTPRVASKKITPK